MKRQVLFSATAIFLALNLMAQKAEKKIITPRENSKVTKEYDENGKLTRYDSVYSFSWSGDTTLLNQISPDQFKNLFGDRFGNFPDSTFMGDSFLKNFDDFFAQPLDALPDSIRMKRFGNQRYFQFFGFDQDSLGFGFPGFDNFFGDFGKLEQDSITTGMHKHPGKPQSKSMEEMMNMLQEHMKKIQKQHQKFIEDQESWQKL